MKYILKEGLVVNAKDENALKTILINRGIKNVDEYLEVSSKNELDPYLLTNMKEGVETFLKHIEKESCIFIVVDSDFDGYASAAIIYNYIKEISPNIKVLWDIHEGKHHGIITNVIPEEVNLVIAPDSGSNDFEEHFDLKLKGVDVIVLDHHVCDELSKDAIVINNQISENYPNKTLCGGGVAYKFCQAVDQATGKKISKKFIDLCGTSLVSDMMDLRDFETHYYVKEGLRSVVNPGLQALINIQEYSIGDINNLTPTSIAFYIAPLINALIRVGTQEEKKTLFKALIEGDSIVPSTKRGAKGKFETLGEQAGRTCVNARARQNRMIDKALDEIIFNIEKNDLGANAIIFIKVEDEVIDTSLTGLIAMKVSAKYKKPTIIARINDDGFWRGSARGLASIEIGGLKEFFEESGFFEYTAGHSEAHGISIHDSKVEAFMRYANEQLSNIQIDNKLYEVDFELEDKDNIKKTISSLGEGAKLWGQGIQEPKIVVKNIPVSSSSVKTMGGNNDSCKVEYAGVSFVKFKDLEYIDELLKHKYCLLTVIGRANINEWGGVRSPQFFIEDYSIIDNSKQF